MERAESPFVVPFFAVVSLAGEPGNLHLNTGHEGAIECLLGLPCFSQSLLDFLRTHGQLRHELGVRASLTILRLARRRLQPAFQEGHVKVVKKCSVKQEPLASPPLRVPGKLAAIHHKVGVPGDVDGPSDQRLARRPISFHDEPVGPGNGRGVAGRGDGQDERIVQAARPLHDGAAACATPEDGHGGFFAFVQARFLRHFVGVAYNDEATGGFPETQEA
jgi:hypothetical protein